MHPTWRRYGEWALLLSLSLFLFWKGIVPAWTRVHSDFSNYYVSAKLISDDRPLENLYNTQWFRNTATNDYGVSEPGKFSPFPPITAWWMLPFTSLDVLDAQRAFTVVNIIFLFIGALLISKITNWNYLNSMLLVLAAGLSLVNNFSFGQMYWIMTVAILFACWKLNQNQTLVSAGLLSLFTALKYFPIVIAAGYFIKSPQRSIRFTAFFSGGLLLLLATQYLYFGKDLMYSFFSSSFLPHLDGELADQNTYSLYFQSWDNLFRNIFVYHSEFNKKPLIDWPAGRQVMKWIIYLLVATSATWILFRNRRENEETKFAVYISVPCLAAMTILPATASYHFILLLIPIALLISTSLLERTWRFFLLALYVLIGFVPYSIFFELAKSTGLLFGYPRLFLVTALYSLVIVALAKRRSLEG